MLVHDELVKFRVITKLKLDNIAYTFRTEPFKIFLIKHQFLITGNVHENQQCNLILVCIYMHVYARGLYKDTTLVIFNNPTQSSTPIKFILSTS